MRRYETHTRATESIVRRRQNVHAAKSNTKVHLGLQQLSLGGFCRVEPHRVRDQFARRYIKFTTEQVCLSGRDADV